MSHHRPFGEFTPLSATPNSGSGANTPSGTTPSTPLTGNMGRRGSFTPAFPSDAGYMEAARHQASSGTDIHRPIPSRQPSAYGPASRRGSNMNPPPDMAALSSLSRKSSVNYPQRPDMSLSRRNSLAGGPRPITRAEYSGPNTPSILSRAGSPVQPLGNEHTLSREVSRDGQYSSLHKGEARQGEFIGSLDCGTTSTRFIVFDKRAKIITEHQTEFQQILPHAGWHEQDPFDLVNAMRECMRKCVENLEWMGWSKESIKGIGITNQRETTLCWSRTTGQPLCNAVVWDDARTNGVVRDFEKKLDEEGIDIDDEDEDVSLPARKDGDVTKEELGVGTGTEEAAFGDQGKIQDVSEGAGSETLGKAMEGLGLAGRGKPKASGRKRMGKEGLVDITGIPLSTYFSAIKLRWMIDHHKEVHDAHESDDLMFGTVDTWLVYALTGAIEGGLHIMDVTNASRTLLISLKTLQWHPPLLRFFGLKASILPKIVSSSEVYGKIHANIETPLTGVPIAGIIGDQQAALVGNKCLSRGEAKNTYGTGSFVLFNTGEELVRSENGLISTIAFQAGPKAKPIYALEGSIAVAGSAIKWLRDQMNLIEESSDMEMLVGSVKDTGGVYFVTAFSGLLAPYWDRDASGTIIGLTAYSTSAHIARAVIEAVCYQTRAVLDVIEKESGVRSDTLKVDGGVTNSDLAMQIQANIGGFKVARPSMRESTALGSALLAGAALGLFGWDLTKPETLAEVNTANVDIFEPEITEKKRLKMIRGWERAVSRAKSWHTAESEEEDEEEFEKKTGLEKV